MLKFFRRLTYWIWRREHEADLSEEIEFHRRMKQRELLDEGLPASGAAAAAIRALGNTTYMREEARAVWIWPWLESVWQDLAYAMRSIRRQPGFALLSIGVLATAIGIDTSLFTAFNTIVLSPWPVKDPGRVVRVYNALAHPGRHQGTVSGFSLAELRFLASQAHSFAGLIAFDNTRVRFGFESPGKQSSCVLVSGNYFQILGVRMERGRPFLPEEDGIDNPQRVAVLSYLNWRNHFGADDAIIGKTVRIDNEPFTVVGVASRDFQGLRPVPEDVWIPFAALPLLRPADDSAQSKLHNPSQCCSDVAGRLAPGVSREQARTELQLLRPRFQSSAGERTNRVVLSDTSFLGNPASDFREVAPAFVLMFLAVTLVLLLACANVGNLLLARAAARRHEIAIRVSLGASRPRLIRQLLTESLVLACAAAAAGMAIAYKLPAFVFYTASDDGTTFRFAPDGGVLLYAIALAVASSLAFGLAPALHGTRTAAFGRVRLSLRNLLLAVQVAMSAILLIGAGLLIRGVQHAQNKAPGFAVNDVSVVSFDLPANSYGVARTRSFVSELDQTLEPMLGQSNYGFTLAAPFGRSRWWTDVRLPSEPKSADRFVMMTQVSGGYFDVLRIPILAGRNLKPGDKPFKTALVSESLAERLWPRQNPVGKMVINGVAPLEIVGVVKDAYTSSLDHIEPMLYAPISGDFVPQMIMRTMPGADARQRLGALVSHLEPRCRLNVFPLSENLERSLVPARIGSILAGVLGLLALALAGIGLFGVFAYVVQQRTRELGIRMALGARWTEVIRVVLGDSARAVAIGLLAGFVLAAAAGRLLKNYLFGLGSLDPVAYGAVVLTIVLAAIAATYVPARRVAKIDPVRALHYE